MPLRALLVSIAALVVPLAGGVLFPDWTAEDAGVLLWLTALVPAFLLAYYRGWQGASLGLALGMAVLSTVQVILVATDLATPNWSLLFGIVLAYLGICFAMGWVAELLHRERRKAENMALTDALTQLPNRRHATIFLDAAFAAAARGTPVTIVLFDLDRFKGFNDRHGHPAGDAVLRRFGEILVRVGRRMNLAARYGGEEFIAVLSACDTEGATLFVERVFALLRQERFRGEKVTACAGIAGFEEGMGAPDVLVAAADRALYAAKASGRDCMRAFRNGEVVAPRGVRPPFETVPPAADAAVRSAAAGFAVEPQAEAREAAPGPARMRRRSGFPATLPTPGPAVAGEGDRSAASTAPQARPGERILVVDDDEDSRSSIVRLLRRLGYSVVEASGGAAALARISGEAAPCDLVVADLVMPGMSGFTMVERMCRTHRRMRVLYISGFLHHDVTWSGAPGHVTRFLGKPMTLEELARGVREVLDAEAPAPRPGEDVPAAS